MKNLIFTIFLFSFAACNDSAEFQSKIMELESQLTEAKEQLAACQNEPGLIHSVFFWLKEDLSEADRKSFLEGVNSLKTITSVNDCYIGPPASTEARDVVDNTYSYALIVHFDGVEAENAYQVDPIHLKFVEDHKDKWTKVVVYDSKHDE